MRKALVFLVLLTLFVAVNADDFDALYEGDVVEEDGWTIQIKSIYDGTALIGVMSDVDNEKNELLTEGVEQLVMGVRLNVTDLGFDVNPEARVVALSITVEFKHDCILGERCEMGDECVFVYCGGYPRQCNIDSNYTITKCIHNDGCCPNNACGTRDNDCTWECDKDSECNDEDPATKDTCVVDDGVCEYSEITDCISADDFCPDTCIFGSKIALYLDSDCNPNNKCDSHYECNDANIHTQDWCIANVSTDVKECYYNTNPDDPFDDDVPEEEEREKAPPLEKTCTTIGERKVIGIKDKYCAKDLFWTLMKDDGVDCENSYECASNNCMFKICQTEISEEETWNRVGVLAAVIAIVALGFYFIGIRKVLGEHNNL